MPRRGKMGVLLKERKRNRRETHTPPENDALASSMLPSFPRRISWVPRQSELLHCLGWHVPALHTPARSHMRPHKHHVCPKKNRQEAASQHPKKLHYMQTMLWRKRVSRVQNSVSEGDNEPAATHVLTCIAETRDAKGSLLGPVCFLGMHGC